MCWALKDTGFGLRKREGHTANSHMPFQKQGSTRSAVTGSGACRLPDRFYRYKTAVGIKCHTVTGVIGIDHRYITFDGA
jgi:hypothetical protein